MTYKPERPRNCPWFWTRLTRRGIRLHEPYFRYKTHVIFRYQKDYEPFTPGCFAS